MPFFSPRKNAFSASKLKSHLRMACSQIQMSSTKKNILLKQNMREIAVLLKQNEEEEARIRTKAFVRDDNIVQAYDILLLQCSILSERVRLIEFEQQQKFPPAELIASVATLIYATPYIGDGVKELKSIQKQFRSRYGKKFEQAALKNKDQVVKKKVIALLSMQQPEPSVVQKYMIQICNQYDDVHWKPSTIIVPPSDITSIIPTADEVPLPPPPPTNPDATGCSKNKHLVYKTDVCNLQNCNNEKKLFDKYHVHNTCEKENVVVVAIPEHNLKHHDQCKEAKVMTASELSGQQRTDIPSANTLAGIPAADTLADVFYIEDQQSTLRTQCTNSIHSESLQEGEHLPQNQQQSALDNVMHIARHPTTDNVATKNDDENSIDLSFPTPPSKPVESKDPLLLPSPPQLRFPQRQQVIDISSSDNTSSTSEGTAINESSLVIMDDVDDYNCVSTTMPPKAQQSQFHINDEITKVINENTNDRVYKTQACYSQKIESLVAANKSTRKFKRIPEIIESGELLSDHFGRSQKIVIIEAESIISSATTACERNKATDPAKSFHVSETVEKRQPELFSVTITPERRPTSNAEYLSCHHSMKSPKAQIQQEQQIQRNMIAAAAGVVGGVAALLVPGVAVGVVTGISSAYLANEITRNVQQYTNEEIAAKTQSCFGTNEIVMEPSIEVHLNSYRA